MSSIRYHNIPDLPTAEKRIEALQDENARIDHDLQHDKGLLRSEQGQLRMKRYDNNREIARIQDLIERGEV